MEELLPAAGACEGEIRIVQLYGKPCPTIGRSRMMSMDLEEEAAMATGEEQRNITLDRLYSCASYTYTFNLILMKDELYDLAFDSE